MAVSEWHLATLVVITLCSSWSFWSQMDGWITRLAWWTFHIWWFNVNGFCSSAMYKAQQQSNSSGDWECQWRTYTILSKQIELKKEKKKTRLFPLLKFVAVVTCHFIPLDWIINKLMSRYNKIMNYDQFILKSKRTFGPSVKKFTRGSWDIVFIRIGDMG